MSKTSTGSGFDAILEEHRKLRSCVADLRRFLEPPAPPSDSPLAGAWSNALAARLVDFADMARRHFRAEEGSDLIEQMGRSNPASTRAIARLLADHGRILADARSALGATSDWARTQTGERADPRALALAVLERFEQHESEENVLIQGLVCDDLGAGD